MEILNFLKEYWVIISFFVAEMIALISVVIVFLKNTNKANKCSLRNDILAIYDRCSEKKQITHYQLQSIQYSYDLYKNLKGNSFIDEIVERIKDFELID